jgi:general secretion pathway protein A
VEVLEHIRLISNLETDSAKLIQIVLVGQPELKTLLARAELRQLDQRITVRYHLKPMCQEDTFDYIRHRIRFAAGGREPLSFSPGAVKRIYRYSGGLPRLINGVCDRALLLAYTRDCKEVSPEMAALSIADLRKETGGNWRPRLLRVAAACLLVAALAVVAYKELPEPEVRPVAVPLPEAPQFSRSAALKGLGAAPEQENLYLGVNAVLAAWQAPPVVAVPGQPATLHSLARQRGLTVTNISADLDALTRLDAPALLRVVVPDVGSRLVAVTGLEKDQISVLPAIDGRSKLTRAELSQIWSGSATVLWKDFHALSSRKKPVEKAEGVKLLQGLLKQVGCYDGAINGTLNSKTEQAISDFQRRERIAVDGQAAGETLLLLYRRAGGFFPPSLRREGSGNKGAWQPAGPGAKAGQNG